MSWKELDPFVSRSKGRLKVVVLSTNGAHGRFRQWLSVYLDAAVLDCAWLIKGSKVSVAVGRDVNSGILKIGPGGLHFLSTPPGGPQSASSIALRLQPLPGITSERASCAVDYEWAPNKSELLIKLPAWAAAGVHAEAAPADEQKASAPFSMSAPSLAEVFENKRQAASRKS